MRHLWIISTYNSLAWQVRELRAPTYKRRNRGSPGSEAFPMVTEEVRKRGLVLKSLACDPRSCQYSGDQRSSSSTGLWLNVWARNQTAWLGEVPGTPPILILVVTQWNHTRGWNTMPVTQSALIKCSLYTCNGTYIMQIKVDGSGWIIRNLCTRYQSILG